MKTDLSFSSSAEVETECLVAVVLDRSTTDRTGKDGKEKAKAEVSLDTDDTIVYDAAADVIAGGEVTGKIFETTILHRPAKLKAKRLLLIGGGKAKGFSAFDLRRVAGAAVRTLKSRGLRSFAMLAPVGGHQRGGDTGDEVRLVQLDAQRQPVREPPVDGDDALRVRPDEIQLSLPWQRSFEVEVQLGCPIQAAR